MSPGLYLFDLAAALRSGSPGAVDQLTGRNLLTKVKQMECEDLLQVRRFNRAVTLRIGALSDDYLSSGRALGQARLLFEIGPSGASVRELRTRLGLDAGYLSRMLRALEAERLTQTQRDGTDARVRRVRLTAKGHKEWLRLDQRSQELASNLLAPLAEPQRRRLLAAMAEVERLLRASALRIERADPFSEQAQACITAYFEELKERFDEGFDPRRTVSAHPEELVPPHGLLLIAYLDDVAIGCGALKFSEAGYGELKRMWVSPTGRGLGIGQRLLSALEEQAAQAGAHVLRLDTHRSLIEARALYARNGFTETAPYNDNPYAHHWFEKRLLNNSHE